MKAWAARRTQSGFTIVELLIVIIVIGILAALVLVAYSNVNSQAKVSNLQADLNRAGKMLNADRENTGGNSYAASLAAVNGGSGISPSAGNTFTYTLGPGPSPYYCLQAVNGSLTYHITSTLHIDSGGCQGLTGSYFTNKDLIGPAAIVQTDATVNYAVTSGPFLPSLPSDTFSVRWTGYVVTTTAGTYTFTVTSDDGERLYVNGALLVDKWVSQGATAWSGTATLAANQQIPITFEYFENTGQATAQLSWTPPSGTQAVIPASNLLPL